MLKACKWCGRIHDSKYDCGRRPKRRKQKKKYSEIDHFRSTQAWTNKSIEIRQRDNYLCQCCIRNLPGTIRRLKYDELSVHHMIPLEEEFDRRLDNENLLTVCRTHHEMAENGKISRSQLSEIIREQELSPPG